MCRCMEVVVSVLRSVRCGTIALGTLLLMYLFSTPQAASQESLPAPSDTATVQEQVTFYMERLGDSTYVSTYGHGYPWYAAAEGLGLIGAPALAPLVERVVTTRSDRRIPGRGTVA